MSSNILVKSMAGVLIFVVCAFGFMKVRSNETETVEREVVPLDKKTQTALGIEGDTPADTLRTLTSSLREQTDKLDELQASNLALRAENERLQAMEQDITSRLVSSINAQARQLQDTSRNELASTRSELQRMMEAMTTQREPEPYQSAPPVTQTYPGATVDPDGTVWVPPLGGAETTSGGLFSNLKSLPNQVGLPSKVEKPDDIPAYTIAKNSTLIGAKAFTALIGRVPVGENVVDPYSFKVIIGNDNLIANGHRVPELSHAVISGRSIGDWTLSCVSGDVYSITFVFKDGRIRTLPKPTDISSGGSTTADLKIGELSDDRGNPCVSGKKISNATKHLAQATIATAATAAASAASASETTTSISDSGGVSGVTGDKGQYVLNQTIAGAAQETAQWLRDRQALEFDAVYVKPGAKVAIHITEELRIDYEPDGRLTHYKDFALRKKYRILD